MALKDQGGPVGRPFLWFDGLAQRSPDPAARSSPIRIAGNFNPSANGVTIRNPDLVFPGGGPR
jgi:hypothetical protein